MSTLIASLRNPKVVQIRSLGQRKARDETGLFLVDGIRMVAEAVATGAQIETAIVAPDLLTSREAIDVAGLLARRGVPRLVVTADVLRGIARKDNPKGLAAVVRQAWTALTDVGPADGGLLVALSRVHDPGNLGTIVRACDAVGASGIILLDDSTDPYHPTALSASSGAIFSQRLIRASFASFAAWKRSAPYQVVGTWAAADHDYQAVSYRSPTVLLMGNESVGLSAEQRAACDILVRIPMVGRTGSLNLGVATAVILYEAFNQRRGASVTLSS